MGKSEYNECRTLPGESEQPQIILDAEAIYGLLIRAEVMMSKVDRVRYANRAIEQILDAIREFILAYDFEDDREMHLKRMCANVAVFLRTMRIIAERNVICIMPRYDTATPDMLKHELMERMLREEFGYVMHPRKRYQQHYSKGVSLLGAHIKYGRVYTDERTIRSFRRTIRKWNRLAYPSMTEHFLSSVNSYLGILKHRNDYGKLRGLVEEVSPKWLKYCHYNDDRRCFVANEGYGHNDVLVRKYGFRFNKSKHRHHDKTGNRRQQEQARLAHFGS